MTKRIQAECDWCHEEIEADNDEDFEEAFRERGWIESREGARELDFCSRDCAASFFS